MTKGQFLDEVESRTGQSIEFYADRDIIYARIECIHFSVLITNYWANSPGIPDKDLQWTQENAEKLIDKIAGVNPKRWL